MLLPLELSATSQWPAIRRFCDQRVVSRQQQVSANVSRLRAPLLALLKQVQAQEPRFTCVSGIDSSSGPWSAGRDWLSGLRVHTPTQFELPVYLQQLGVFSMLEQSASPGCISLKLADGRKRSMSLWVEFITASGYLSARKIRARFAALVHQSLERNGLRSQIELLNGSSEVRLRVHRTLYVRVSPAFRCSAPWPSTICQWPSNTMSCWPPSNRLAEAQSIGFDLLSQEFPHGQTRSSSQIDCWVLDLTDAENHLLVDEHRRKCLSILKTLRERHLEPVAGVLSVELLRTILLFECEKHPLDHDWSEQCLPYRLTGILLQLISCLQNRSCPHFLQQRLDLLAHVPPAHLETAARLCWRLARELLTNAYSFDQL